MKKIGDDFICIVSTDEEKESIACHSMSVYDRNRSGVYEWNKEYYRYYMSLGGIDFFEPLDFPVRFEGGEWLVDYKDVPFMKEKEEDA